MKKSPFLPKSKNYLTQNMDELKYEKNTSHENQKNKKSDLESIYFKYNGNESKECDYTSKCLETDEYQLQLRNLEEKIYEVQNSLYEQTIKNGDLEYKLKEREKYDQKTSKDSENNVVNIQKLKELEILLKHSRKQNLIYSDEIKDMKKQASDQDKLIKEIEYLKHENRTLKAFIVAKNKMTHYRHAFEDLKIENYCPKCSESIKEYIKSADPIEKSTNDIVIQDIQVPEVNKSWHGNVVNLLKNSSSYTIQINNNGDSSETMDQRNIKSVEDVPCVNRKSLRFIMEKIDIPVDSIDSVARTVIHLGDQLFITVDWDNGQQKQATVKYIGNLDERYQSKLFLGVKLHLKESDIPKDFRNNGCFRNKRYFSLNSDNGFFLHFSNIVSIYNKENAQFENFEDFLFRKIDPKASQNTRKNNSIKGLIEK